MLSSRHFKYKQSSQKLQCKQTIIRKSSKVLAPTTKEQYLEDLVLSIRYSIILNIDTTQLFQPKIEISSYQLEKKKNCSQSATNSNVHFSAI